MIFITVGHHHRCQQQQAPRNIGETPVAEGMTATAQTLSTARTPGVSTAVRTTAAAETLEQQRP
jgi:hypothetical protein